MTRSEITIGINITNIDEVTEKISKLKNLLEEVNQLIDEIGKRPLESEFVCD